VNLRSTV